MEKIFSPFEVKESVIKIGEKKWKLDCIGSFNTEMEVKKVTKKCAGVTKKSRTRGTGYGTGTFSLHIPYDLYCKLFGMDEHKELAEGVNAYGATSIHPEFSYTGVGLDEDNVEVLISVPRAVVSEGQKWDFENGAEEVAEIELAFDILPDELEEGMYHIPVSTLPQSITKEKWLNEFTTELVKKAAA